MIKHTIKPILTVITLFFLFFLISYIFSIKAPEAAPSFGNLDLTDSDIISNAVIIPNTGFEYVADADQENPNAVCFKLTITAPRENTYGFIIPNTTFSPDLYINGSPQAAPDKKTESSAANIYYYTPRTNKMELLLQYVPDNLSAADYNAELASLAPEIVFGCQSAIENFANARFSYSSLCAGFCLCCVFLGLACYFIIFKKSAYINFACAAISAFFIFIFSNADLSQLIFGHIDSAVEQKLYTIAIIALAGMFALFSEKLFVSKLNHWIILGFNIYSIICAIIVAFAPLSVLPSIIMIFDAAIVFVASYIFVKLLSTQRDSGSSASIIWITSTALIIAFLIGKLTNQIKDGNLIYNSVIIALGSGAICLQLTSSSGPKRYGSLAKPSSALTEAMQIVNRLNYIKTQLLASAQANNTISHFDEISSNPALNRRPVGMSEEDELRRDLKNISTEANRLSLLAQRMLNASYSGQKQFASKVQLSRCAEKAYDLYAPMFEDKNNSFTLETEPWLPYVFGEDEAVMQAISHILTNSNDRTKNGAVMVHVARGTNKRSVSFVVHDTGEIIEPEALAQLFSSNSVPPQNAEVFELYMARTILESMDADLKVKSDINTGTYLMFELPDFHEEDE